MRRFGFLASATFFGAMSVLPVSRAYAYCSEPSAPSCASGYGAFEQWEFDSCKSEMESYKDDVESFMRCNNDEAEEALEKARNDNQSATSDFNDAVEAFNRRASGG